MGSCPETLSRGPAASLWTRRRSSEHVLQSSERRWPRCAQHRLPGEDRTDLGFIIKGARCRDICYPNKLCNLIMILQHRL